MFLKPDFFAHPGRACWPALTASLVLTVLAGCSSSPTTSSAKEAAGLKATQPASASTERPHANPLAPPVNPAATPANDAIAHMLAYADRVRLMPPAELGLEATRLGEVTAPADQLRLSLVLSQLRQLPDLLRAQELLTRVLGNATAEAQALHPLARLLAARYGEQRRLEELLEKQTQQTRDVQRRLDQTHERLEALKAIERSLTNRPPAAAVPEPARRARTPAP